MLEKEIESYLVKQVQKLGGLCLKFVSPGNAGVPDRIILLPGGRFAFAELKAPKKHERPLQIFVQKRISDLGVKVFSSVDSKERCNEIIKELSGC